MKAASTWKNRSMWYQSCQLTPTAYRLRRRPGSRDRPSASRGPLGSPDRGAGRHLPDPKWRPRRRAAKRRDRGDAVPRRRREAARPDPPAQRRQPAVDEPAGAARGDPLRRLVRRRLVRRLGRAVSDRPGLHGGRRTASPTTATCGAARGGGSWSRTPPRRRPSTSPATRPACRA